VSFFSDIRLTAGDICLAAGDIRLAPGDIRLTSGDIRLTAGFGGNLALCSVSLNLYFCEK
jgi:hypothetical protein